MGIRVLIAEDHTMVRQGLRALLDREGFDVVGEVSNGHEAVESSAEADPDVDLRALMVAEELAAYGSGEGVDKEKDLQALQKMMKEAADNLEYEKAALLRDRIRKLQEK